MSGTGVKAATKLTFMPAKPVSLKSSPGYDENWLEKQISAHPEMLELGESVKCIRCQVQHKNGGRVDVLLKDDDNEVLYTVELMLGPLDAGHITRALDYYLREQTRPETQDWSHVCVIVAEEIQSSRYVQVAEYLATLMPLIVIELSALQIGEHLTVKCTKLFDGTGGGEEELGGEEETLTRDYWIKRASALSVELTEKILPILKQSEEDTTLTFKKHFIGLAIGNRAENFIYFSPKKEFVRVAARVGDVDGWSKKLTAAGFDLLNSNESESRVKFRLTQSLFESNQKLLAELCDESYKSWFE